MNTLVADSGSTCTEWALITPDGVRTASTAGINPVHMSAREMADILHREATFSTKEVDAVRFYGAGCIPAVCGTVAEVLRRRFGTENVSVESDLTGAARGTLGDRSGIACILGTGSNSGLYDGFRIVRNVPPLGYILGDEGSGADLGKRLIGNLLKGVLPSDLTDAFYREYPLEYAEIIESVYRRPGANRFLAGFCPFLGKRIDHPQIRAIVHEAFSSFTERNLLQYSEINRLPVSFAGSVAYHFEIPLREVLRRYGLTVGRIERSPMEGLIRYHKNERND